MREDGLKAPDDNHSLTSNGKISIVIVTYNAACTLQECLDSIYLQMYPDIEIIVIDGKSTDETIEILKKNQSRIAYWKTETDKGSYDAMNKAINYVTGKWIYFLGADDVLFADFSKFASELKNNDAIYYGSVTTKGLKRFGKVSDYHMAKTGIFHQAMIYPAKIFEKHRYDQKYRIFADYVLNMRCYNDKSIEWVFKDYIIANFNHTGLSGTQHDEAFEMDKARLIYENFGLLTWLRFRIKQAKRIFHKEKYKD